MLELTDYKNFFNKSEEERVLIKEQQNKFTWEEDRKIARYLGTSEIYLISIIRNVLHHYNWAQHKKIHKQELKDEERNLLELIELDSMQIDVTDKAKYNSNKTKDQPVEIKPAPLQTSNIEKKNQTKK